MKTTLPLFLKNAQYVQILSKVILQNMLKKDRLIQIKILKLSKTYSKANKSQPYLNIFFPGVPELFLASTLQNYFFITA